MSSISPARERQRLVDQHRVIREQLAVCERLATRKGPRAALELTHTVTRLAELVEQHNLAELAALEPLLAAADAWGPERTALMIEHHRHEHGALVTALRNVAAASEPMPALADAVTGLIAALRKHMDDEEREVLNARVLHDDIVARDANAG
jgi:hypothetical protein